MAFFIRHEENFIRLVPLQKVTVRQSFKMHLVDCIRSIRNELAQENLMIRINGMNHKVQQLFRLRLKFVLFLCHLVLAPFQSNFDSQRKRHPRRLISVGMYLL